MIGRVLDNRYAIVRQLGQGGMGAVYEARHTGTGRRVALKIILEQGARSSQHLARFQREAKAVGAAESDHIAQVFDTGTDVETGSPYIAMEYLDGEDVEALLQRVGPLPVDLALRIAMQAASGLESAHGAGVVHRDIKPANMFLAKRPDGRRVLKLLDFGIAKFLPREGDSHSLTKTGAMVGSPLYMSPEQARGGDVLDARTDLWSLGISMYESLCGERPNEHVEGLGALLMAICSTPPPSVQVLAPWVPVEVAAIVQRALMVDRQARYASATELVQALGALLPHGHDIVEAMLTPISESARALVPGSAVSASSFVSSSSSSLPASRSASAQAPSSAQVQAPAPLTGTAVSAAPVSSRTLASTDGGVGSIVPPVRSSSRLIGAAIGATLLVGTIAVTWTLARTSGEANPKSPASSTGTETAPSGSARGAQTAQTAQTATLPATTPSAVVVTPAVSAVSSPTASASASSPASSPASTAAVKRPLTRPSATSPGKKPPSDEETSRK